jgi:quercetin dioxygenase-like cupin family protein
VNSVTRASVRPGEAVEQLPGIWRTTLCWNEASMLCHFHMMPGAKVPLHTHAAAQNGYVVRGRVRFLQEDGEFVAGPGDAYLFEGNRRHGAEVLEDSEVIEVFTPMRPEYR